MEDENLSLKFNSENQN